MNEDSIFKFYGSRSSGKTFESMFSEYVYASKIFNDKYKGKYKVELFLDLSFLNIIIIDLENEKSYKCQILNNCINYLSSEELVKCYEELIEKLI